MSNNSIVGPLCMGQPRDLPQSGKHVCIFGLARKGALITAEVICTVCGVYLSSQLDRPRGIRQSRTGKSAKSPAFGSSNYREKGGSLLSPPASSHSPK
jgi:hypothetical protein